MSSPIPDYEFIAFIDESGDPSIKRVRPIDVKGGTEWFVLSAVLISRQNELLVDDWLQETAKRIGDPGTKILKFTNRSPDQRLVICKHMAELPIRVFTVASNKRNMRRYRNKRAEKMDSKQWFYNWIVRILIERITDYCWRRAVRHNLKRRHVKFIFSHSGGHSYSQTRAYQYYLGHQAKAHSTVLKRYVPIADVMDWNLVEEFPHYKLAGLQYADISAGAFYQAADKLDTGPCDPRYALALKDRVARDAYGNHRDYGVVLQPMYDWTIDIGEDQREIFRCYGYGFVPMG